MNAPSHITVRLGEDFNWWVQIAEPTESAPPLRGVLDPRQLAHLNETFDSYRAYGFRPQLFADAFQAYRADAEISEGVLRLVATDLTVLEEGEELFALPVSSDDDDGPYSELLGAIAAARVRKLNATQHFARNCTEDEMVQELELIDTDRYFSDDTIHVFDELNEILNWSPAEWDESSSS